jgi:hypothetical protein
MQSQNIKTIGYIRVSSDKQDLNKQRHLLLEYAQRIQVVINEFIEVEISSTKTARLRKIDELNEKLETGDLLLVAELSRLGRNMFDTLNIINKLIDRGVNIDFIRQPELSTYRNSHHVKLLLAVYSYFAESEREFIALRTKQIFDLYRPGFISKNNDVDGIFWVFPVNQFHQSHCDFLRRRDTVFSIQNHGVTDVNHQYGTHLCFVARFFYN